MTEKAPVARADENLYRATCILAGANGAGTVSERDGLLVAASGVPLRSFNNMFVTRSLGSPAPLLSDAIAYFEGKDLPFRLRVRDGIDGVTDDVLAEYGLRGNDGIPCLTLAPLLDTRIDECPLEIRTVADDETLRDHVDVVASGFDMPSALVRRVFSSRLIGEEAWRGYVGYAGGRPVAASQLIITDGVAGIFWVATLEEFRRKGFGQVMTRHAMNEGVVAGCDMASLQASPMGRPVYERMGFETVAHYRTYVPEEV